MRAPFCMRARVHHRLCMEDGSIVTLQDAAELRRQWTADQLAQQLEFRELQQIKADRMADAMAQERWDGSTSAYNPSGQPRRMRSYGLWRLIRAADLCRQRRAELAAQAHDEREADIRELAETLQREQGQAAIEQEAKQRAHRQDVAYRCVL
jgi:hypothetical protein